MVSIKANLKAVVVSVSIVGHAGLFALFGTPPNLDETATHAAAADASSMTIVMIDNAPPYSPSPSVPSIRPPDGVDATSSLQSSVDQGHGRSDVAKGAAAEASISVAVAGHSRSTDRPADVLGDVSPSDRDRILRHIARFKQYPKAAEADRPTGLVAVGFVMSSAGDVLDVWIERSSGTRMLDEEAISTILRAQPLPGLTGPAQEPTQLALSLAFDDPTIRSSSGSAPSGL